MPDRRSRLPTRLPTKDEATCARFIIVVFARSGCVASMRNLFLVPIFNSYFLLFTSSPHTSSASFPRPIHPTSLRSVPPLERCEMKSLPSRRLGRRPADATHLVEWKSIFAPAAHWDRSLKHSIPTLMMPHRRGLSCCRYRAESSCVDDYWDVVPRRYQPRHAKRKSNLIEFLVAIFVRIHPAGSAPKSSTPPAFPTVLCRRDRLLDKSPRAARPIARLYPASPGAPVRQVPSRQRSFTRSTLQRFSIPDSRFSFSRSRSLLHAPRSSLFTSSRRLPCFVIFTPLTSHSLPPCSELLASCFTSRSSLPAGACARTCALAPGLPSKNKPNRTTKFVLSVK